MIKAIIFDLDGTLADTIESIRAAVNSTLRHYGFPEKNYDDVREGIGGGARNLIRMILPASRAGDEAFVAEALAHYGGEYEKTFRLADRCYPGMREATLELARRGYKLAILSNKPDRFVIELAKLLFPDGGISYAAGQTGLPIKPDPTTALVAARELGAGAAECAFVGDSDVDILTAKNAGMRSVGCAWGYRGEAVLREAGADLVINSPEELLALFCGVEIKDSEFNNPPGNCFCGHDCSRCVTYLATVKNDDQLRRRSQGFYRDEFGYDIPLNEIHCLGGLSDDIFFLCRGCPWMKCCRERGIGACSECGEYPCKPLAEYKEKYVNKCNQI